MLNLKKLSAVALIIMVSMPSLYAQIQQGQDAPTFSMYQYKDKTFDTDTVYGKKIVTFIFGSIT